MNNKQFALFFATLLFQEHFISIAETAIVSVGWTEWTEWSQCSKPCDGNRNRTRTCQVQTCSEEAAQTEYCTLDPAKLNCVLGEWEPWSKCTVTCGGGIMRRKREVTLPKSLCGKCLNIPALSECNTQPCQSSAYVPALMPNPEVVHQVLPVVAGVAGTGAAVLGGMALGSIFAEFLPLFALIGRRDVNDIREMNESIRLPIKGVAKSSYQKN